MERPRHLSRRALVRVISFTAALIVALAAAAIGGYTASKKYRATIEYSYQRALGELTDYISNLDITLEKGQYAATQKQLDGLSSELWRQAANAKIALGQLPLEGTSLENTYKFLSQVGNFCMALSGKVEQGEEITEEERQALDQLSAYASSLSQQLGQMESDLANGELRLGDAQSVLSSGGEGADIPDINSGFHEMEEGFTDYPTLIYDGPFSDHIQQQKPKFLSGKAAVSQNQALLAARKATGARELVYAGKTSGSLPCYLFTDEAQTLTVSVTQAGGVVEYFLNSRQIGEPLLSVEEGLEKAQAALADRGLGAFAYRYYSLSGGILTVNFAAVQESGGMQAVLYPDLVKVGVALDTGEVVSYDAKGYIQNHTERELPAAAVTEEEARAALSPRLMPESHAMALVPSDGLSEVYCHEFLCRGQDGERVLVYVDVQTGMEEQILILLESDAGVLAM